MKTIMDAAGRLIIPKALRQGMVAVPQGKLPALSADEVRETLERLRR